MTVEEIINKLQHKDLKASSILGPAVIFEISGEIAFVIDIATSEIQVYTIDLMLRMHVKTNLSSIYIKDDILYFENGYLIL